MAGRDPCPGRGFPRFRVHDFIIDVRTRAAYRAAAAFCPRSSTLVPLHGLHVTTGCIWMIALSARSAVYGLDTQVKFGLLRLGLFWHFLDIVWIAIFSVVYLEG